MKLKCTAISDLHNDFPVLDGGDILFIAGDLTTRGSLDELVRARAWVEVVKNQYKHVLFTPGNHDLSFEFDRSEAEKTLGLKAYINEVVEIEGLRIFLSPYSLMFGSYAYQKTEANMANMVSSWPLDIDIAVVHGPCRNLRDFTGRDNVGSLSLGWWLDKAIDAGRLKMYIHGHIHESYGAELYRDKIILNAALGGTFWLPPGVDQVPVNFVIDTDEKNVEFS